MRLIDADKIVWRTQLRFDKTQLNVDFVFKQDIDAMPTVEAEPIKRGEWIFDYNNPYRRRKARCSACNKYSGIGGTPSNQLKPYCPNCGARCKR